MKAPRSRRPGFECLEPRTVLASVPVGVPEIVSLNPPGAGGTVESPDVALADDGRYVIAWTQRDPNGVAHVRLQPFDAYHRRVGNEIVIASNFGRSIDSARVAIAEDGQFAVTYRWEESTISPDDKNIYVRVYDWGQTTPIALERVNVASTDGGTASPDVAMSDDGRFVVAWESIADDSDGDKLARVYFRSFSSDGTPDQTTDRLIFDSEYLDARQYRPTIAITNDGGRVAFAWEEQLDHVDWAVYDWNASAGRFDFELVKSIPGDDHLRNTHPSIGIDDNRTVAIGYRDNRNTNLPPGDDNYTSFEVWRFDQNGNRVEDCGVFCTPNDLFFISGLQPTTNAQIRHSGTVRDGLALAVDGDGSLAMTWAGQYPNLFDRPGVGEDVYVKEFLVRPERIPVNYTQGTASGSTNERWGRVNSALDGNQLSPSIDKNESGFIIAYVDSSSRTVQVRRYFDRTDFSGERFDAYRSVTDPSDQLLAGQSAVVEFSVRNIAQPSRFFEGTRIVDMALPPPVSVSFYLSRDPEITTGDKLLGVRNFSHDFYNAVNNLATHEVFLPRAGDPFWNGDGTYYLGMIVDSEDLIFEDNETNNANRGELLDRNAVVISGTVASPPQFAFRLIADKTMAAPGGSQTYFGFLPPLVSQRMVSFPSGTSAGEGIYQYDPATNTIKVAADVKTPVPGGTGNFGGFSFYGNDFLSSDGGNVAFFATGAGLTKGIYTNLGGTLKLVADEDTNVPGGSGKFSNFVLPATAIDESRLVFGASDADFNRGLYEWKAGTLTVLVNNETIVPGGSHTFDELSNPSIDGDLMAFRGVSYAGNRQGIYLRDSSGLRIVADSTTTIPGRSTTFSDFHSPGDLILQDGDVAFLADNGVYLYDDGELIKIADQNTAIPNGVGNFTGFSSVAVNDGVVAFLGFGSDNQQGIYINDHGTLLPVVAAGDELLGRTVDFLSLHNEGFDDSGLGFAVNFTDGSQAVVFGRRMQPSVTLNAFQANGTDEIELRYTIVDGPLSPFDIRFYRSPVAGFDTSATQIDQVRIESANDLATGTHTKKFKIGGGNNEVSLPGAGLAAANADHFLVATAQQTSVPLVGAYHVTGGPIVLHGGNGAENVHVKIGSVQIEWDGQALSFPESDVSAVFIHGHGGTDTVDLTQAGVEVHAFGGDGHDILIAGATTQLLDGGSGNDTYHLGLSSQIGITDPGGDDHLNFSTAVSGVDFDLDLQDTPQAMLGGRQLTLIGQFENLIGTPFLDSVRVDVLSTAPRTIDLLGSNTTADDRLQVDTGNSSASMSNETLLASGYQPIEFGRLPILVYSGLTTWRRPTQPLDVTNDGFVVPQDVLVIINELNQPTILLTGNRLPESRDPASSTPFYDANGDGFCTALDALQIINHLNRAAEEGEGAAGSAAIAVAESLRHPTGAQRPNASVVDASSAQRSRASEVGSATEASHPASIVIEPDEILLSVIPRTNEPLVRDRTAPTSSRLRADSAGELESVLDLLSEDVASRTKGSMFQ